MAEEFITLEIGKEKKIVKEGTTYMALARQYQKDYEDDIVLVSLNNRLQELNKKAYHNGKLEFVTTKNTSGRKSYRRSLIFLMETAMHRVIPDKKVTVKVHYSLRNAFYCTLSGDYPVTAQLISAVKKEMLRLVEEDISLQKSSQNTDKAMEFFSECGLTDKVKLFRYRRSSKVNIYAIGQYKDYYYGYMVPSTGYLKYFDLSLYDKGFVLIYPDQDTKTVRPFSPSEKLHMTLQETQRWSDTMEVATIGQLNDRIVNGNIQDLILVQEALMEKKIGSLAEMIVEDRSKKFVMIAGPSSSGKTTFSHRLSIQLSAKGLHPHPFPLDDYYVDRDRTPLDADGNKDFECLEALDTEQLNKDLPALLAGEAVEIPIFNFKTGKREPKGKMMQLGPDDILVIEGIHGLNDKLSYSIDAKNKFKIYISALSALNIDEHNYLPTTDGRLIRRIVRDARTRNSSAQETIGMWASVRRGEENYIFPYQEEADVMFNSALIYELAVLKTYAEPLLFAVDRNSPEYQEAKRLLKFLDYFLPVPSENISSNSILREFIGGGCFHL